MTGGTTNPLTLNTVRANSRKRSRAASASAASVLFKEQGKQPRDASASSANNNNNILPEQTAAASLQHALNANRRLQHLIRRQLKEIHIQKQANRRLALAAHQHPCVPRQQNTQDTDNNDDTVPSCLIAKPNQTMAFYEAAMKKAEAPATSTETTTGTDNTSSVPETATTTTSPSLNTTTASAAAATAAAVATSPIIIQVLSRAKGRLFRYQIDRTWNLDYFMDPAGDLAPPAPNEDTIRRQQLSLRAALHTSSTTTKKKKTSRSSRCSKAEMDYLLQRIQEQQQPQTQTQTQTDDSNTFIIDWNSIEQDMKEQFPSTTSCVTAWDCMCQYARHSILVSSSSTNTEEQQQDEDEAVDDFSSNHNNNKNESSSSNVMTLEQDEILFRYLALMGPQFVWDPLVAGTVAASPLLVDGNSSNGNAAATTSTTKRRVTVAQLWLRSNHTASLNPKLTSQPYWTADLERKLVLLMKLYHNKYEHEEDNDGEEEEDDQGRGGGGAATNAAIRTILSHVAAHFPDRWRDHIKHKWVRSLDPALDHEPWKPEEDERLKRVIHQAITSMSTATTTTTGRTLTTNRNTSNTTNRTTVSRLADIAREHIANRKPHQVYARWIEIATPEEIVAFEGWQLLGGGGGDDRNEGNETENNDETTTLAARRRALLLLSPDEFRVEWKG
jgi:hypothetical protein